MSCSTFSNNDAELIGGIQNANDKAATVTLSTTVLAKSAGGNINSVCAGGTCKGKIVDGGYNISDDASFRFTTKTSKARTNPRPDTTGLQYNGGPTKTIALQTTSPAVNSIPEGYERLRKHREDRPARGTEAAGQEVRRRSLREEGAATLRKLSADSWF